MLGDVIYVDFAKRLRQATEKQGVSNLALAQRTGLDDSTISRFKNGQRRVSPENAVVIAKALRDLSLLDDYCRCCPVAAALRKRHLGGDAA